MTRWVGASLLLLGAVPVIQGQAILRGVVREDGSGRPLSGVEVLIEGSRLSTITDSGGRYLLLDAPTGNKVVLFRFIGYRPQRVRVVFARGDTAVADAALLSERVQQLDPIETTASMPGPRGVGVESFVERRKLGFGHFFDSTALRRYEHRRLTDLLRSVTGIKVEYYVEDPKRPDNFEHRLVSTRALGPGGHCYMSILLDGAPLYRSGTRSRPLDFRREFTELGRMHAIEVYRSASEVPVEYGGSSEECGLILLWSRPPGG
jgi:hypothetical protein